MLTICIPVYNYDITRLVKDLYKQAITASVPFEILVMDDASLTEYRVVNAKIDFPEFRYIQLTENIGRSKIRNALVTEAQYPYLIFMDCDSAVASDSYVSNYLLHCRPGIICYGGRIYESQRPGPDTFLRWKYGVERESLVASERKKQSNYGFCTNNFLIDREIFKQVNFNENLAGYGHEDTFFGLELLGNNILIEHIDNPLIHLGLEDARVFLEKTENGILNLQKVDRILNERFPHFTGHSKLMRSKIMVEKFHLKKMYLFIYKITKPLLRKNLLGTRPFLFIFDLYRLGFLITLDNS